MSLDRMGRCRCRGGGAVIRSLRGRRRRGGARGRGDERTRRGRDAVRADGGVGPRRIPLWRVRGGRRRILRHAHRPLPGGRRDERSVVRNLVDRPRDGPSLVHAGLARRHAVAYAHVAHSARLLPVRTPPVRVRASPAALRVVFRRRAGGRAIARGRIGRTRLRRLRGGVDERRGGG